MFKKLLPILGLLLLVSCEGELTTEQLEDAVNGAGTETVAPKPITDWLDQAAFLEDATCTVTSTTLTDEFINEVGENRTSVDYFMGQEFKLGGGTNSYSKSTGREYIGFQSDAALNPNVRMFITTNKEGTHNSLNIGTPSGNNDEDLSIRAGSFTLNDEGTVVGTMEWMRTDVGREFPRYTIFNQETEVFTITLKCK